MTTTHPAVHASSLTLWNIIYSTSRGGLFALLPMIPTHMIFFLIFRWFLLQKSGNFGNESGHIKFRKFQTASDGLDSPIRCLFKTAVVLCWQSLKTAWNLPHRVTANSLINKNSRILFNFFHNLIYVRIGTSE